MFFQTFERIKFLATRHSGRTFTPRQFTHLIRMQFRDPQLRFNSVRSQQVTGKDFCINGEYRPYEDEHNEPCVYITLTFNTACKKISFADYNWESMSFHLADVVTHEYLHQYYCRRRGYRHGPGYRSASNHRYSDTMQDYLGCEDEILAHAFNVASEMTVYGTPMIKTQVYRTYKKYFDPDCKVMLKLKKQTNKYIKQLELS